ncbi:MAG: methyltransferase domain-containing protein [Candidatus Coatesbacteria bacterium]|nr:MAG: methyltransferase domain-containing protein [Candidatus Coatesbacteria bacterium]
MPRNGESEISSADGPYLSPGEEERQAAWYAAHRREIYRQLSARRWRRVLEIGCGSGVVAAELAARASEIAVGLDRREEILAAAVARASGAAFACADAGRLPFRAETFDAVVTSFTLLWLRAAEEGLEEARRVLREGGVFVALAEPDYEGAIDYPEGASTREAVAAAIRRWGGDPAAGRKLPALLSRAGLEVFRFGVLNSAWTQERWSAEESKEIELLGRLLSPEEEPALRSASQARAEAIARGERCYFLPLFYAVARKAGADRRAS